MGIKRHRPEEIVTKLRQYNPIKPCTTQGYGPLVLETIFSMDPRLGMH